MIKQTITVQGNSISFAKINDMHYLSLTDIVEQLYKRKLHEVLPTWLRNRNTTEFLNTWETLYNPNFNSVVAKEIMATIGTNSFYLTVGKWSSETGAIGILSPSDEYSGEVSAHLTIALEFCSWLSPAVKVHIMKALEEQFYHKA